MPCVGLKNSILAPFQRREVLTVDTTRHNQLDCDWGKIENAKSMKQKMPMDFIVSFFQSSLTITTPALALDFDIL